MKRIILLPTLMNEKDSNHMKKNNNWFYAVFILGPLLLLICLLVVDKVLKTYSISFPQWLSLFIGYLTYYSEF